MKSKIYVAGGDGGLEAFLMLKKVIIQPEAEQTSPLERLDVVKHKNSQ